MNWDYGKIRKNGWDTAFKRGWRSWIDLVAVCFLFAFIGVSNSSQIAFVGNVDTLLGADNIMAPGNMDILQEYIRNSALVKALPFLSSEMALDLFDGLTRRATWAVRIFALNMAYIERNPGEVVFNLIMAALITLAVKFLVQNVASVGKNRYVMESRFKKNVLFRRILAPYHRHNLIPMLKVMVAYHVTIILWLFTIVGGVYKYYQYRMVPYIVAENPHVTWKEAKKLSADMTRGYKWKMFLTELSYIYIWILTLIPVAGIMVAIPLMESLNSEMYFVLRSRTDISRKNFLERGFDDIPYVKKDESEKILTGEPAFELKDISILPETSRINLRSSYRLSDALIFFYSFAIGGWIWEVIWCFVQENRFANRGTMYGPWIPIYGVGAVIVVIGLDKIKKDKWKLFGVALLASAILEYATSFVMDFMFNSFYWDYHAMFMNLNGRICLAGILAFGIIAMIAVYVAGPALMKLKSRISDNLLRSILTVLTFFFVIDLIVCIIYGFNSGAGVGGVYGGV